MKRVVVTGARGSVGRRVVAQIAGQHLGVSVVAVDRHAMAAPFGAMTTRQVDLADLAEADLVDVFAGADSVVHLATSVTAGTTNPTEVAQEIALLHRLLDALSAADVPHLVMVTSAMVYGAWPDNPVPLTEDSPIRPNPDFDWAVQRRRLEVMAMRWGQASQASGHGSQAGGRSVTVLRPAAVVAEGRLGQLADTLRAARSGVVADGDPPVQYLHADDLAAAVVTAVSTRYNGALNVAPDGWIPPDTLAELEGPQPRLRMSSHFVRVVSALRWRTGLAPTPPGVVPYTACPWVVASDRLRALGWSAAYSNEEAWVVSHDPGLLETVTAKRRQQVLLGVLCAVVVTVAGLIAWVFWWLRRLNRARTQPTSNL